MKLQAQFGLIELVELTVNSGSSKWIFGDQPVLRPGKDYRVAVRSIEVVTNANSRPAKSPDGVATVSYARLEQGYLAIYNDGEYLQDDVPLASLIPANFNGRVRETNLQDIDWQKCYVLFPDPTVLDAGDQKVQLLVTYARVY